MVGGRRPVFLTFAMVIAAATLAQSGCVTDSGSTGPDPAPGSYDRLALVNDVATRVIAPAYAQAATQAAALVTAVTKWKSSVSGADALTTETLGDARQAWLDTMSRWQVIEVVQMGPAAPPGADPAGAGGRDEIYSWPTVNPCRVDQEVAANEFESTDFIEQSLVNVYGLDALEYLLFNDSMANTCPESANLNVTGEWDALGQATIANRRAGYAVVVAEDIESRARELNAFWADNAGNLTGNGSTSVYGDVDAAVNALFRALFYVESVVQDEKLAIPAGIVATCPQETCPELVESPWSGVPGAHVRTNLETVFEVMFGGGHDFEAALKELDAAELAGQLRESLAMAVSAASETPVDYSAALRDDPDALDSLHASVKTFNDLLRGEMVVRMMLQIPSEAAGDTD